jgi:hypothetical protein
MTTGYVINTGYTAYHDCWLYTMTITLTNCYMPGIRNIYHGLRLNNVAAGYILVQWLLAAYHGCYLHSMDAAYIYTMITGCVPWLLAVHHDYWPYSMAASYIPWLQVQEVVPGTVCQTVGYTARLPGTEPKCLNVCCWYGAF